LIGDFDQLPRSGVVAANDVMTHLYRLCARRQGYEGVAL